MADHERYPLSRLPKRIKSETGQEVPYWKLLQLCRDGAFSAVATETRWYFRDEDMPEILAAVAGYERRSARISGTHAAV